MRRFRRDLIICLGILLLLPQAAHGQWLKVRTFNNNNVKCLTSNGSTFFIGTKTPLTFGNGIVLRSTDGAEWEPMNGQGWPDRSETPSGGGVTVHCLAVNGATVAAGTDFCGVLISPDEGKTWRAANNGLPKYSVYCFGFSGLYLFAASDRVYRSMDLGASWSAADKGLPTDPKVISFAAHGSSIFAGTMYYGIFVSKDSGVSWSPASAGLPSWKQKGTASAAGYDAYPEITCLVASGSKLFAGTGSAGVYVSADNGKTWTEANAGLPANATVGSITRAKSRLFAVTRYDGVFSSADQGRSWQLTAPGIPARTWLDHLALNASVLLACSSGEAWRLDLAEALGEVRKEQILPNKGGNPQAAKPYLENGHRAVRENKYNDAVMYFSKAIELDPQSRDGWFERAFAYMKRKGKLDPDRALADIAKFLELSGPEEQIYYTRAEVYYQKAGEAKAKGDERGAVAYLNKALADYQSAARYVPENINVKKGLAWTQFSLGDLDSALAGYCSLLEIEKKQNPFSDALETVRSLELVLQEYWRRKREFDCGQSKLAWFAAGEMFLKWPAQKPDYDLAIKCYSRAIDLGLKDWSVYFNRHRALKGKGDFAGALAELDRLVASDPSRVLSYSARGDFLLERGELDKAIADYGEGIRLRRWHMTNDSEQLELVELLLKRAEAFSMKRDWDRAIGDYRDIEGLLRPSAAKAKILYKLGQAYKNKGDAGNAQTCLEQAYAMDPSLKKQMEGTR